MSKQKGEDQEETKEETKLEFHSDRGVRALPPKRPVVTPSRINSSIGGTRNGL